MEVIVGFIDENRDELGVEPICRELQVAPSTYYAAKSRPLSARAVRDACLIPILVAIWKANFRVYGVRKLWKAARRAGHDVGRDQVARLMGHGRHRGPAPGQEAQDHQVRPGRDAPSRSGQAGLRGRAPERLVGERPDLCGHLVGLRLRVLHHRRLLPDDRRLAGGEPHATDMVLDALEMARLATGHHPRGAVSVIPTPGSQFTSIRYGEHLERTRGRRPPSAASATRTTMRWPSRSTPPTRASSSGARDRGRGGTSTTSNWPPSAGCTGSTPSGCTSTSTTCRRQSSRRLMLPRQDRPGTGRNPIAGASIRPRTVQWRQTPLIRRSQC